MSIYYLEHDIENIKGKRIGEFYMIENFKPGIRVEVKLAYLAILNTLVDKASFNEHQEAYLKIDSDYLAKRLGTLANKKVDADKIQSYMIELAELDLLDIKQDGLYLRRMI